MHLPLAAMDVSAWLSGLQGLNPETNTGIISAGLLWFCGGGFFGFAMCAFNMMIRATKGAYRNVEL